MNKSVRKLTLSFCALGVITFAFILNYWNNAFPNLDNICNDTPLVLTNAITSCTKSRVFKESLDAARYQYSEHSFTSSKTTINPGLDLLDITVKRYKIYSCTGEAKFTFVNGYLSSAIFFPASTCEFNGIEHGQELEVRKGENFEGRKFFFWGDERLETYHKNWLAFFG